MGEGPLSVTRDAATVNVCRTCGAPIIWAVTQNGRRMPLDADPVASPRGWFTIEGATASGDDLAVAVPSRPIFVSHFATCPQAAEHRR
jgi:hypothetical protein